MQDPPTFSEALAQLRSVHVENVILPVLIQLIVIITAARLFSWLFRKLGQSGVVGEIVAGLLLGPSLLSRWDVVHSIFHPGLPNVPDALADQVFHWTFTVLSQIGLILLLFLIGLEFDFEHLKVRGTSAVAISLTGIMLPFGLGLAIAPVLFHHPEIGTHPAATAPPSMLSFALFLGTALSITALPILGRMMIELNISRTRLGAITITSAAVDDAMGWILLASVAALVRSAFSIFDALLMFALTVGYALLLIFGLRPWLVSILRKFVSGGTISVNGLACLLALLLASSIVTNKIGIFAIFGAFLLGGILSGAEDLRQALTEKLRDFVTTFFLPIFFTYTGLRTKIQALDSWQLWLMCGLVLSAAIIGKFGGCALAARLSGFSPRESACIGVMMNTRALMELIVINVGYELRVIPESVFCMLVLMAVITTVMTTPILLLLMRTTELEPLIEQSEFRRTQTSR